MSPTKPRLIANKGELFDDEFDNIVKAIVHWTSSEENYVAEFAWYVQAIDSDERIGSLMIVEHKTDDGEEVTLVPLTVIMHVNGIDGAFLWRAGVDMVNRVVAIRYRRRGS